MKAPAYVFSAIIGGVAILVFVFSLLFIHDGVIAAPWENRTEVTTDGLASDASGTNNGQPQQESPAIPAELESNLPDVPQEDDSTLPELVHAHNWLPADCVTPRTCTTCGETEGEPLLHTFADAGCTTPMTCTACGETEGEALGHDFIDADCTTPMTCLKCGETEGEPSEHEFIEANFQMPQICIVCAEIYGEPLPPRFHAFPYAISPSGSPQRYVSITHDGGNETIGRVTMTDFRTISGDYQHEPKDGFEWQIARFKFEFDDEDAYYEGASWEAFLMDYYSFDPSESIEFFDRDGKSIRTISYFGANIEILYVGRAISAEWTGTTRETSVLVGISEFAARVPVGYDGLLVVVHNPAHNLENNIGVPKYRFLDQDSIFFRMSD